MNQLETTYNESFFAHRNSLLWRSEFIGPAIKEVYDPNSIVDVGCAIGDFVQWFDEHKIRTRGIEGSTAASKYIVCKPEHIIYHDMRKPYTPAVPYSLAMAIEVAEHVEPEYAEIFVKNMVNLSYDLLLTISGPGEKGHSHVNLQPMEYWDNLFAKHRYYRNKTTEKLLKEKLDVHKSNRWISAIIQHLCCYRKAA